MSYRVSVFKFLVAVFFLVALTPVLSYGQSARKTRLEERCEQVISIDFENVHIRGVLQYFSEMTGVNIVLDESVFPIGQEAIEGQPLPRVTIQRKDVKFREALAAVLRPKNLVYRLEEHLIWITTPERMEMKKVKVKEPLGPAELEIEKKAAQVVSVDFEKAHLRPVLAHLSKIIGIDIIIDEKIFPMGEDPEAVDPSPRVTIRLQEIPLIEGVDVILRMKGLSYRFEDNAIRVTYRTKYLDKEDITVGEINRNYILWEGKIMKVHFYFYGHIKQIGKGKFSGYLYDKNWAAIYAEFTEEGKLYVEKTPHRDEFDKKKNQKAQEVYAVLRARRSEYKNAQGTPTVTPYLVLIGTQRHERSDGNVEYIWQLDDLERR